MTTPPNAVDRHVGARIRTQRLARGATVEELAATLGISPGQALDFEDGLQRVGARRLVEIARFLETPPSTFFAGVLDDAGDRAPVSAPPAAELTAVTRSVAAAKLLKILAHVQDPVLRRRIVDLATALSEEDVKSFSAANDASKPD